MDISLETEAVEAPLYSRTLHSGGGGLSEWMWG